MINKVGILGSGTVGRHLAIGFQKLGYEVTIGSRNPGKLKTWIDTNAMNIYCNSLEEAAMNGDLIVLCTAWLGTENTIKLAGKNNFKEKIVIDVTNPLIYNEKEEIPHLGIGYPDSGGKTIQKWLPESKIVKTLNMITAPYMANPILHEGMPDMFLAGNDTESKTIVTGILSSWGWPVINLGDINQAYLLEAMAMIWIRYGFLHDQWSHAFKLLKK